MAPVSEDARDQLITRRGPDTPPGFEVRQGVAAIDADSRLPRGGALRAVGWDADFQQVAGELRLPPGWRLFHAGGVDDVRGSWIATWTLLDLFLVLVTTLAAARLWGKPWGALALAALALAWIEPGAPRWSVSSSAGPLPARAAGCGMCWSSSIPDTAGAIWGR